jgi:hypothetical protein
MEFEVAGTGTGIINVLLKAYQHWPLLKFSCKQKIKQALNFFSLRITFNFPPKNDTLQPQSH